MSLLSRSTEPRQPPKPDVDPDTLNWLRDLTQTLPEDLVDPKELENNETKPGAEAKPSDAFMEDVRRLMDVDDDVDQGFDPVQHALPLTREDTDIVDRATRSPPPPPKPPMPVEKPKPRQRRSFAEEPEGYNADYSFAESLPRGRDIPEQTGEWPRRRSMSAEDKTTMRRLLKAAREKRRRDRLKETGRHRKAMRF